MGIGKAAEEFRNYTKSPGGYVEQFYRKNHTNQTLAFVEQVGSEGAVARVLEA